MTIEIKQTAEKNSPKTWRWSIWLDGTESELNEIESVTYQLHSTFKNPVREIDDRTSGFRLDSSGWGQFMVYLTLRYVDGREQKRKHWLRLGEQSPSKELEQVLGEEFRDKNPTVFLSYSVVDTLTAEAVRKNLENKGFKVLDAASGSPNVNLADNIESLLDQADFGVSIESDIASEWVRLEAKQMQERALPVLKIYAESPANVEDVHLKIQPLGMPEGIEFESLIDTNIKFEAN